MDFWRMSGIVSKILFYALGILLIYWLLLKITGHSPTSDQILIMVFSFGLTAIWGIVVVLFKIVGELRELRGEFRQFTKSTESEFSHVNKELNRISVRLDRQ